MAGGNAGGEDGFVIAARIKSIADKKYTGEGNIKMMFHLF